MEDIIKRDAVTGGFGVITIAWLASILAIVIAIVLIIISLWQYFKGNMKTGLGLLVTGGIIGAIGGVVYYFTKGGMFGLVGSYKGSSENSEFDGETVKIMNDADCGCTGAKENEKYEEFEEDINELDYLDESDEDKNPFEDETKKTTKRFKKSKGPHGKKVTFKGGEKEVLDSLREILEIINVNDLKSKAREINDTKKDLSELLDSLKRDNKSLKESYDNLDLVNKEKVDNLLDELKSSDADLNKKIEEFRNFLTY